MFRYAPAIAFVLAVVAPAAAQPGTPVTPQVVTARVENGSLVWATTHLLPVQKPVTVAVVVNGREVVEARTVTELTRVTNERSEAVKNLRVTDGAGRLVPADRLAARLADDAAVVIHVGRLPEAYRKLFREDAIIVELPGIRPAPRP